MGRDGTFIVSGLDRAKMASITQRLAVNVSAVDKATTSVTPLRKARVALYRPWAASIDEGWTRWILENYAFAPVNVYNTDLQAGHLRERFNALIIPDMSKNTLMEGHKPGTVPGQYAGGIGEPGLDAIREFVSEAEHSWHSITPRQAHRCIEAAGDQRTRRRKERSILLLWRAVARRIARPQSDRGRRLAAPADRHVRAGTRI